MDMSQKRSNLVFDHILWGLRKRGWERNTVVRETEELTDIRTHLTKIRTDSRTDIHLSGRYVIMDTRWDIPCKVKYKFNLIGIKGRNLHMDERKS